MHISAAMIIISSTSNHQALPIILFPERVRKFPKQFFILKAVNAFTPVRVPDDVEEKGLDEALHGEKAYDLV